MKDEKNLSVEGMYTKLVGVVVSLFFSPSQLTVILLPLNLLSYSSSLSFSSLLLLTLAYSSLLFLARFGFKKIQCLLEDLSEALLRRAHISDNAVHQQYHTRDTTISPFVVNS